MKAAKRARTRRVLLQRTSAGRTVIPPTERSNPASASLDKETALEIARIINREDRKVAVAVARVLPQIARAIDAATDALRKGGRILYVGTGTSGRLGALDAAECPPTFGADPKQIQYIVAGGNPALHRAMEAEEDSRKAGRRDMARRKPGPKDLVVGLAASGHTPYTLAAVEYARRKRATVAGVTCAPGSPLAKLAQIAIEIDVGPEVVTGSTRMKAGTAEKLVCNTITTGAFTQLGYVYGNLMVNVALGNSKLIERGIAIVRAITGVDRETATNALNRAGEVRIALVMIMGHVSKAEAQRRLRKTGGNTREALAGL